MHRLSLDPTQLYDTILAATPDFAYVFDLEYRFRYANRSLLDMWGKTWEEASGKRLIELGYEQWHADKHEAEIRQVVATGRPIRGEVPFDGVKGRRVYDYIFVPVFGESGKVEAVVGTTRDITDRHAAEEARQAGDQRIRQIVEVALDAVPMTDSEGIIREWNRPAETVFGWSRDEALGRQMGDLIIPEEFRAMHDAGMKRYLSTGKAHILNQRVEIDALHRGGRRFPVELTVTAQHVGGETFFTAFVRDITEVQLAKQALIEARNSAEAASIAKTDFLANMSHEIRTPMNAVIGLSHLLSRSEPLSQRQRDFLHTLQTSADTLLSLINDLLDVARIEAGTIELEDVSFDFAALIDDAVGMLGLKAREKGLYFTAEVDCLRNRSFRGDPTRLRQVILNLCGNAVKFTDQGGVRVMASCREVEGETAIDIRLSVEDSGIGIAADKLGAIFEKFVQADSSTTRKYGGSGLGLAITRTLTETMGGTLSVDSRPGRGSIFTLELRLEPCEEMEVEAPQESPMRSDFPRGTALIVEDNTANVMVASAFLEQFGFAFEHASSGAEAVRLTAAKRYALILMDVQMPGMTGFEATKLIRENERERQQACVPILGVTAHAMSGDRERCLGAGMDDYLPKPLNPAELETKIDALVPSLG